LVASRRLGIFLARSVEGAPPMKYRNRSASQQHWSIDEIPYAAIQHDQVAMDQKLFYLLTSGSFVEITSDLYTRNLVDYFHGDEVGGWLEKTGAEKKYNVGSRSDITSITSGRSSIGSELTSVSTSTLYTI
jgi:hypothetical protein